MTTSLTGIVITQWRDPETTAICLAHVASLHPQPRMVVVVDNESDARVLETQMLEFPDVRFIGLGANTGHANAVNLGVRHLCDSGCTYALLLDNDAFVTPDTLGILEAAMAADPGAGAASPLILSGRRPGLIWYGGGKISFLGNSVHDQMWKPGHVRENSVRRVGYVTSCALLVRVSAFIAACGFDASLFAYADDLDFSYRLTRSLHSLLYVPIAEVTHGESVNVIKISGKGFRDYYTMRNRLIVIRKHGTAMQKWLGIPCSIFWYCIVHGCVYALHGEPGRTRALFHGAVDYFRGRTGRREG